MTKELSPERWAINIHKILNTLDKAFGTGRFPVQVKQLAVDFSKEVSPDDPITDVMGASLPGFEGALFPASNGRKGWGIIYNNDIKSQGRINFTLAHEFGHYLMHRSKYPKGIQCTKEDMNAWNSEIHKKIESEANCFAAGLLMPFDDFRKQIKAREKPSLDALGACAERYEVSLTASIVRWLRYTERRAVLVVSRDGFILWARSSEPALKTRAFFRTANRPPVAIPETSLAAQGDIVERAKETLELDAGTWFASEPCEETAIFSKQYDFTISLLHLDDEPPPLESGEDEQDAFDNMASRSPGSPWLG